MRAKLAALCPITGVIGQSAPMFDIWGDTVNIASRMMSTGVISKIQVCSNTEHYLAKLITCALN